MKKICPTCRQEVKEEEKTKKGEIEKVITVFKMVSGYEKNDKEWDRLFFARYSRAAKDLIRFFGNWKDAADCIEDVVTKIREWNPEANISLDTIIKNHSAEWKKNKQEKEASRGIHTLPSNGNLSFE